MQMTPQKLIKYVVPAIKVPDLDDLALHFVQGTQEKIAIWESTPEKVLGDHNIGEQRSRYRSCSEDCCEKDL